MHVLDFNFNFLTLKMTQVCIVAKVTSDYQLMEHGGGDGGHCQFV